MSIKEQVPTRLMDEAKKQLLLFCLTPNLGPQRINRLLDNCPQPQDLINLTPQSLNDWGWPVSLTQRLARPSATLLSQVEQSLRWAESPGQHLLSRLDANYPNLLAQLPDAPPVLYVKGNLTALHLPQVAMVGSRQASIMGSQTARDFAAELCRQGLAVTSGLALGIDAAAHEGSLLSPKPMPTIAVLGTGIEQVYPSQNRSLAERILSQDGALVSELPLGCPPKKANFPRRNRIISGLSLGVLVVEASLRSGSLLTAKAALEQNREVFAIPGSIHEPRAQGCNQLIQQGAKLVTRISDILEELPPQMGPVAQTLNTMQGLSPLAALDPLATMELQPEERQLLNLLGYDTVPVDLLVMQLALPVARVNSLLIELELKGLVEAALGGYRRLPSR